MCQGVLIRPPPPGGGTARPLSTRMDEPLILDHRSHNLSSYSLVIQNVSSLVVVVSLGINIARQLYPSSPKSKQFHYSFDAVERQNAPAPTATYHSANFTNFPGCSRNAKFFFYAICSTKPTTPHQETLEQRLFGKIGQMMNYPASGNSPLGSVKQTSTHH